MKKLNLFALFLCMLGVGFLANNQKSFAVTAADWRPGRIIDDVVFQNKQSMSVQQIQQFLDSKVPNCDRNGSLPMWSGGPTRAQWSLDNGKDPAPYTCLKEYVENPTTKANNASDPTIVVPGGLSAAQLIYNAAQAQNVNPQVYLVLLQKEQSLVTDDWPYAKQFERATGNNCPDTAPCDPAYAWLSTQVNNAGAQFNYYVTHFDQYNYAPGWNNILYNPNTGCGRQSVYIENKFTAALYIYTPYVPNQAALNNMYGTGDGCSAYGNRNFWRMFNDWFGSSTRNLVSNGGGIYLIEGGLKRVFPNEATFLSYSYRWSDVLAVSSAEINLIPDGPTMTYNVHFRDGFLIRSLSGGVFVVDNGTKRPFPNEATFYSYGYTYADAIVVSSAEVSLIPDGIPMTYKTSYRNGRLITSPTKGIYRVENGVKRAFPSEIIFTSNSYKWSDVLTLPSTELNLIPDGTPMSYNVNFRNGFLVRSPSGGIYVVDSGTKRPFPNEATFFSYGYTFTDAALISNMELSLIPEGAAMPLKI